MKVHLVRLSYNLPQLAVFRAKRRNWILPLKRDGASNGGGHVWAAVGQHGVTFYVYRVARPIPLINERASRLRDIS